jgi:hypothetical protein
VMMIMNIKMVKTKIVMMINIMVSIGARKRRVNIILCKRKMKSMRLILKACTQLIQVSNQGLTGLHR